MKTKINTPENAKRAKAILIAGLILLQASLMASENITSELDSDQILFTVNECEISPVLSHAENICFHLNEAAIENEYEIEDWMCNIHNHDLNTQWDEEEYELEEWMYNTDHVFWKDLDEAEESEAVIECWMANPDNWLNPYDDVMLTAK